MQSLQQIYRWRFDVPLLIVVAGLMLFRGLTLPILNVRKLVFWQDDWSVVTGLSQLFREGHVFVAIVILLFSVMFPAAKLVMLLGVWLVPQAPKWRHRTLSWLGVLGKWSMLDVFVVALLVLMSKTEGLINATPRIGVYVFALAIGMSMVLTMYVHRLAKRADGGGAGVA